MAVKGRIEKVASQKSKGIVRAARALVHGVDFPSEVGLRGLARRRPYATQSALPAQPGGGARAAEVVVGATRAVRRQQETADIALGADHISAAVLPEVSGSVRELFTTGRDDRQAEGVCRDGMRPVRRRRSPAISAPAAKPRRFIVFSVHRYWRVLQDLQQGHPRHRAQPAFQSASQRAGSHPGVDGATRSLGMTRSGRRLVGQWCNPQAMHGA